MVFDWGILSKLDSFQDNDKINNDGEERSQFFKPNNYIYKMIETMLPKAMVSEGSTHLRMLELWATSDTPRKGWIKLI